MITDTAVLTSDVAPRRTVPERAEPASARASDLGALRARFSALFQRIADTAAEREHTRTLAYAPILWLKDSGFTALRVPPQWGGSGVSISVFFELFSGPGRGRLKRRPNSAPSFRFHRPIVD